MSVQELRKAIPISVDPSQELRHGGSVMKSTQCGIRSRWTVPLGALLVAMSTFAGSASAQTPALGRINGRVTDAATGAPLTDVQVYLVGANLGAISRQN